MDTTHTQCTWPSGVHAWNNGQCTHCGAARCTWQIGDSGARCTGQRDHTERCTTAQTTHTARVIVATMVATGDLVHGAGQDTTGALSQWFTLHGADSWDAAYVMGAALARYADTAGDTDTMATSDTLDTVAAIVAGIFPSDYATPDYGLTDAVEAGYYDEGARIVAGTMHRTMADVLAAIVATRADYGTMDYRESDPFDDATMTPPARPTVTRDPFDDATRTDGLADAVRAAYDALMRHGDRAAADALTDAYQATR